MRSLAGHLVRGQRLERWIELGRLEEGLARRLEIVAASAVKDLVLALLLISVSSVCFLLGRFQTAQAPVTGFGFGPSRQRSRSQANKSG